MAWMKSRKSLKLAWGRRQVVEPRNKNQGGRADPGFTKTLQPFGTRSISKVSVMGIKWTENHLQNSWKQLLWQSYFPPTTYSCKTLFFFHNTNCQKIIGKLCLLSSSDYFTSINFKIYPKTRFFWTKYSLTLKADSSPWLCFWPTFQIFTKETQLLS